MFRVCSLMILELGSSLSVHQRAQTGVSTTHILFYPQRRVKPCDGNHLLSWGFGQADAAYFLSCIHAEMNLRAYPALPGAGRTRVSRLVQPGGGTFGRTFVYSEPDPGKPSRGRSVMGSCCAV